VTNGTEVAQIAVQQGAQCTEILNSVFIAAQTIFLGITYLIVRRYTEETQKLRQTSEEQVKETQKQTDQMLKPFIIIKYDSDRTKYQFVNKGSGVALNVNIKETAYNSKTHVGLKNSIGSLAKEELHVVPFWVGADDCQADKPHDVIYYNEELLSINIMYENVLFEQYYTSIQIKGREVSVMGHGRKEV